MHNITIFSKYDLFYLITQILQYLFSSNIMFFHSLINAQKIIEKTVKRAIIILRY